MEVPITNQWVKVITQWLLKIHPTLLAKVAEYLDTIPCHHVNDRRNLTSTMYLIIAPLQSMST